jgi:hypothetical protein
LSNAESANIANTLLGITTGTQAWRGPLTNVADLVGHFVSNTSVTGLIGSDYYQYSPPSLPSNVYTYAGLSAALSGTAILSGSTIWDSPYQMQSQYIQRFREAPIRALADCGQTRVWNLMIDLISQSGSYSQSASNYAQFTVASENRYWLHLAIDRLTGAVLDQSLEQVQSGPIDILFGNTPFLEYQPAGTVVGALQALDDSPGNTYTYSLVSGAGGNDNASFAISGSNLVANAMLQYSNQSTYQVLVSALNQNGQSFQKSLTVNLQQSPYNQWKYGVFGPAALSNPALAGDTVDPAHDGLPNLLKYALGEAPLTPSISGLTAQNDGAVMTLNYTRASSATDITMHAYWSENLNDPNSWTNTGVTETMLSDNGTLQQWQATVPVNSAPLLFMRLMITRP